MANGQSLGILSFIKEVTKDATPQYKVEPYGFLASLYVAHSPGVIKNDSYDGHTKTVKVKKKKRLTVADTRTTGDCSVGTPPPYSEDTVSIAGYREIAFHIEDEAIALFDSYASAPQTVGGMSLMWEFMDDLQIAATALLSGVNQDLVTLALAANGKNRRTGSTAASTINIGATINNNLSDGPIVIQSDFKYNNMAGKPIVVGAGLFNNFMMQQLVKGGANYNGVDTRLQAAGFDFFLDYDLGTLASNADQIVVYEANAIQIVEYLKYQGFKAGAKPGASQYGTLTLPMMSGDQKVPVKFDFQLRYNDCAVTEANAYGDTVTYQKGFSLIISKNFGLYTIPTDAYQTADVLTGNRGSLKYNVTNS